MKSTTILVLAVLAFIATVMVVVDAKAVASRPHKGKHAPGKFGHKYRMTAEEEENESDSADDW